MYRPIPYFAVFILGLLFPLIAPFIILRNFVTVIVSIWLFVDFIKQIKQTTARNNERNRLRAIPKPLYYSEDERFHTFENYISKAERFIFSVELKAKYALAGLYWTGTNEVIKCSFCHFKLIALRAGDTDPFKLHFRFNSSCCLLNQNASLNRPRDRALLQKCLLERPYHALHWTKEKRLISFASLISTRRCDKNFADKLAFLGFFCYDGILLTCYWCSIKALITEDEWKIFNKHVELNQYCPSFLKLYTRPEPASTRLNLPEEGLLIAL